MVNFLPAAISIPCSLERLKLLEGLEWLESLERLKLLESLQILEHPELLEHLSCINGTALYVDAALSTDKPLEAMPAATFQQQRRSTHLAAVSFLSSTTHGLYTQCMLPDVHS